jgi:predicted transcriptional regulator
VTSPDDFFDQIDDAEAVTADDTDSVQSSTEQSEADRVRSEKGTTSQTSTRSQQRNYLEPEYVARCRFCRCKFTDIDVVHHHEGRCKAEPVAQCIYCEEELQRQDSVDKHIEFCEAYHSAIQEEAEQEDNSASETENEDSEHFSRLFIDPQPHEFHAYLKWDCGDRENPLRSYFGLRSLQGEHEFEDHGRLRTAVDIDGDQWNVEFGFKDCGIAPRDSPNFQLDEVREYLIYVYPSAYSSWDDAKSEARKRAYFKISPRWPDIETKAGLRSMSNPCDIEGYDVEIEGSNWDFEQYPVVLQQALDALADRQGFRFNSPTPIRPEDFSPERIHRSSNIVDAELYVRVKDGETGQVIAYDGTLHRISLLLAGDREGYAKSVRDDRECSGHYHTATIDSRRAGQLVGDHELAKEFKHYYMRNPDAVEGTALENPKVGVSFQNSIHDGTLYWDDVDTLTTELDEALLNVLEWSDIPTRPDGQMFVADDYFEPTGSRRWRKLLPDRLPRIESKQDDQLFATASQMNETDTELVETLLTDGGNTSPEELAESIDVHVDTVYRALKRLSPLIDHSYGEVQVGSKYMAQELTGYIDSLSESVQSGLESVLDSLARAEAHGGEDNPWKRWLDRHGVKIDRSDDADPDDLDIGFQPADLKEARQLVREGALQWSKVTGERLRQFAFEFAPAVTTIDGKRYAPERFADALGTPG